MNHANVTTFVKGHHHGPETIDRIKAGVAKARNRRRVKIDFTTQQRLVLFGLYLSGHRISGTEWIREQVKLEFTGRLK